MRISTMDMASGWPSAEESMTLTVREVQLEMKLWFPLNGSLNKSFFFVPTTLCLFLYPPGINMKQVLQLCNFFCMRGDKQQWESCKLIASLPAPLVSNAETVVITGHMDFLRCCVMSCSQVDLATAWPLSRGQMHSKSQPVLQVILRYAT